MSNEQIVVIEKIGNGFLLIDHPNSLAGEQKYSFRTLKEVFEHLKMWWNINE